MKIWAHTIVNNEENFIWFSLMSVIDYVDKILVWDSGSTDKTVEIIKEAVKVSKGKIEFKQVGEIDAEEFTKKRQEMLEQSDCDWILVLDGDEVWWKDSIKKVINKIKEGDGSLEGIAVPMVVPVGDIYHLQDEKAGQYKILGRKGHLSLRAINKKIPGLHVDWPYGKEGYFDENKSLVQERMGMVFIDAPYLHLTHLKRSGQMRKYDKYKYELGNKVGETFRYPEVFFEKYPEIVPSPWIKMSKVEFIKASILTPLRKIKRKLNG